MTMERSAETKRSAAARIGYILTGALLMGFLWRARGTNGWGSSWGVLNAGFVFLLFLQFAVPKRSKAGLPLVALSGLSFMLTTPAWGTLLTQITGVLNVSDKAGNEAVYAISPVSGVIMMLCLGFGLAGVYGIMAGRCFSEKEWRIKDYAAVLITFLLVDLLAKATVSHLLLKLIEPQAVTAFSDGLAKAGLPDGAYAAYMRHFSSASWAKKIVGGRNYFSSVGTLSLTVSAAASLLTARFFVKDRFAAKTGLFVCGAFSFAITVSDLFFFFGSGGLGQAQGFTLPEGFAAWSLWEYFTGFIAGGLITAFLLQSAPSGEVKQTLASRFPARFSEIFCFLLAVVGGLGINTVRPLFVRLQNVSTAVAVIVSAAAAALVLIGALLYKKKTGTHLHSADMNALAPALTVFFTLYIFLVYMFVGRPEISSVGQLHNILMCVSAAAVPLFTIVCSRRCV